MTQQCFCVFKMLLLKHLNIGNNIEIRPVFIYIYRNSVTQNRKIEKLQSNNKSHRCNILLHFLCQLCSARVDTYIRCETLGGQKECHFLSNGGHWKIEQGMVSGEGGGLFCFLRKCCGWSPLRNRK